MGNSFGELLIADSFGANSGFRGEFISAGTKRMVNC